VKFVNLKGEGIMSKLGHAAITVKNMETSLAFYTKGLGFKKAFELNRPETGERWIIYLYIGDGQFIELFYDGVTDNPWNVELRGFNHLCVAVDDIHSSAKQLEDAGYKLDQQPNQGCDSNWQAWVTDPDGIRIELMQLDEASPQLQYLKSSVE
jgi:lactoylglutathione lyase